jgi:hypothetical protein
MTSPTPPWKVDPWDLRADLDKIRQQWPAAHEILSDAALSALRAPAVSEWTCGEQAGHILLAGQATAQRIEGNLADPQRDRDGASADFTRRVLEAGGFPRGRAKAPAGVDPVTRQLEDLVALLPSVVASWEAIAAREEELASCPARARHFAFGYLTSAEWVRMCAVHTAHHLAIVRDMREA